MRMKFSVYSSLLVLAVLLTPSPGRVVVVMAQFVVPEQPAVPSSSSISRPIEPDVVAVNYTDSSGDTALQGFLATPPEVSDSVPVPAIVIVPDWDGVNLYEQQRAMLIAQDLNYIAFAADIYGTDAGDVISNMTLRKELADAYRSNATLFSQRIQAAVDVVKALDDVDANKVALIGYCFGGTGVLQYATTLGDVSGDEVQGVVSFHGGLTFILEANSTTDVSNVTTKILVLSGGEDDASSEIMDLELILDSRGADWEMTRYSGIEHAWTVFDDERYNEWADQRSWDSMVTFLQEAFAQVPFEPTGPVVPNAIDVEPVVYTDEVDGTLLQSYISLPNASVWERPLPVVMIIPDWDGNNEYEQERATLLAESGYIGFAADIYGADLQSNLTMEQRIELATTYRSNATLFVQRMQRALTEIKTNPLYETDVDGDNIAVIGYCLGGTGVIQLAFSGNNETQVVVSFHGGHEDQDLAMQNVTPYTLILSGGDDDAHGNQTELEAALNAGNAIWEITRYSGVVHGFTKWDAADAYSLKADARSWESMMTTFEQLLPLPVRLLDGDDGGDVEAPAPLDNSSDSPSSVPNQSPGAPDGPTISPLQSGAPSSIPTIMPNATVPELPTGMPTILVVTSSGKHHASYQHLHIATAILSLCFLWTIFS